MLRWHFFLRLFTACGTSEQLPLRHQPRCSHVLWAYRTVLWKPETETSRRGSRTPRRGSGSADETISFTHLLELCCGLLLPLRNSNNTEQQELGSPQCAPALKSTETGSTLYSKPVKPDTFLIMANLHFTSNICRLSQIQGEHECVTTAGRVRSQAGASKKKKEDGICEMEQNQSPGLGSETRPRSVSNRLQLIIPCDQQLYSHRSSGMRPPSTAWKPEISQTSRLAGPRGQPTCVFYQD